MIYLKREPGDCYDCILMDTKQCPIGGNSLSRNGGYKYWCVDNELDIVYHFRYATPEEIQRYREKQEANWIW